VDEVHRLRPITSYGRWLIVHDALDEQRDDARVESVSVLLRSVHVHVPERDERKAMLSPVILIRFLIHDFRQAVQVLGEQRVFFSYRKLKWVAVHARAARCDYLLDFVVHARFEHVDGPFHVHVDSVLLVALAVSDADCCLMVHEIHAVTEFVKELCVSDVSEPEREVRMSPESGEVVGVVSCEVVESGHDCSCVEELFADVAADEACATSYGYFFSIKGIHILMAQFVFKLIREII